MHSMMQDYLQRLNDLHQDILTAIEGLSPEALDWIPIQEIRGDMNSINVLVTHLCGAERYWIGEVACGDPAGRLRAAEFQVSGMDAETLAEKIQAATAYARSVLQKLKLEDLAVKKSLLRDAKAVTAGWALLHALEHTAIHLGHIQITRQLWQER
jgi:uncharacterized damage-inducible protein DinB